MLLSEQEFEFPQLFSSLQRALLPLLRVRHADRGADGFSSQNGAERERDDWDAAVDRLSGGRAKSHKETGGKVEQGMRMHVGAELVSNQDEKSILCELGDPSALAMQREVAHRLSGVVGSIRDDTTFRVDEDEVGQDWGEEELAEESLLACNIGGGGCGFRAENMCSEGDCFD